MEHRNGNGNGSAKDSFISFCNSEGVAARGSLHRVTRQQVVFEVYNPYSILQLSEKLHDFQIIVGEQVIYSGDATVASLVNTGVLLFCEANLADPWLQVDSLSLDNHRQRLRAELNDFYKEWGTIGQIHSDYKVAVTDAQAFFVDLRDWLQQVELAIRSQTSYELPHIEREVVEELSESVIPRLNGLFAPIETIARQLDPALHPIHSKFIQRQLHPLLLSSPFAHRTYQKPLGYAGDYEMVDMILRSPHEGSTLFSKLLNVWMLSQGSAAAHRNRIAYLTRVLEQETQRRLSKRPLRVLDMGCGPAKEIQDFLKQSDLSSAAEFTLWDFNDETLAFTSQTLHELKRTYDRASTFQLEKKSVHQILKDSSRNGSLSPEHRYDFIYCAGLFDYLSDRICKRLLEVFYSLLAPGGLLIATNVDPSNPSRVSMAFVLEWHLVYRDKDQLKALLPSSAEPGSYEVKWDPTGVNVFIEIRKPNEASRTS